MPDHLTLIAEIERAVEADEIRLTEWEDDRLQEWKLRETLTDRQDEILTGIWRRATR